VDVYTFIVDENKLGTILCNSWLDPSQPHHVSSTRWAAVYCNSTRRWRHSNR